MIELNQKVFLEKFLKSQRLAVIATQTQNNIPYTNLIAFSQTKKENELLFGTLRNTSKYRNIIINNKVSILFDNRANSVSDFQNAITITAIGTAHEVDKQQYQDKFLAKHPNLGNFIQNKDCALMLINVEKYILIENFQEKTKIKP